MAAEIKPISDQIKQFQETFDGMAKVEEENPDKVKASNLTYDQLATEVNKVANIMPTPLEALSKVSEYYSMDEKYKDAVAHINTAIYKIKQIHERDNKDIANQSK
jgi:archaellum component FlaC